MHEKIADYDEYFGQVLNEFGKEYLEQFAQFLSIGLYDDIEAG